METFENDAVIEQLYQEYTSQLFQIQDSRRLDYKKIIDAYAYQIRNYLINNYKLENIEYIWALTGSFFETLDVIFCDVPFIPIEEQRELFIKDAKTLQQKINCLFENHVDEKEIVKHFDERESVLVALVALQEQIPLHLDPEDSMAVKLKDNLFTAYYCVQYIDDTLLTDENIKNMN